MASSLGAGARVGRYEIVAALGAGGMGEVYRARDAQLEREVALKVLPEATFADPLARARLLREARTAAQLSHPHICTVHEVGEADGRTYIAMELLRGEPLSIVVAGTPLGPDVALRYGVQLADALSHAHAQGIVHRDLKSANIMVTADGRPKILDFGLAKRSVNPALADAATQSVSVTEEGAIAGTLPCMAPEQLRGAAADTRSDVWALGLVLYEMVTGVRAFAGSTSFEITGAILHQPPAALPSSVPADLAAVIERCLEKEPLRRYQNGGELRVALESIPPAHMRAAVPPSRRVTRRRAAAAAVFAGLGLVALAGLVAPEHVGRLGVPSPRAQRIESVAVLPFVNFSGDPQQGHLAAGLHDAMITELARLRALKRVPARAAVMRFRDAETPVTEIGRELGVDVLLTASVLRAGDRVTVNAQLVDPATEAVVWSDRFTREMRDVLSLQNELVVAVARETRLQLDPQERERLNRSRVVNPAAHDEYLKGKEAGGRFTPESMDQALRHFQRALEIDPSFALAHAAVSSNWMTRGHFGFISPKEAYARGKTAALTAIALDDTASEAHRSLALAHLYYDWDWAAAETAFRRSIAIEPRDAHLRMLHSFFLAAVGRPEEALAERDLAIELEPGNKYVQDYAGWQSVRMRRYDEGIAYYEKVSGAGLDARIVHKSLWVAFDRKGMYDRAVQHAQRHFSALGQRQEVVRALMDGYAAGGYHAAMKRGGDALAALAAKTTVLPTSVATLYAHAGENALALDWLERGYDERDTLMVYLNVEPFWDGLRTEPRFRALLQKMRFPSR